MSTLQTATSLTVKRTTLAFCSNQQPFVRDIPAKFGIPNLSQSPDIGQSWDGGISDFGISGQSLIKKDCHNYRINHDIDMKLGPATKRDKRRIATLKKFGDNVIWVNCVAIVQFVAKLCRDFPIRGQFAGIWKLDSGGMVYKTYIFTSRNLLHYRNWKQN